MDSDELVRTLEEYQAYLGETGGVGTADDFVERKRQKEKAEAYDVLSRNVAFLLARMKEAVRSRRNEAASDVLKDILEDFEGVNS